MNLYEYDRAIDALVDAETGEVTDYNAFLSLAMERDSKIENVAVFIKNLLAEASLIKAEETALKARREPLERRAARLREYLAEYLGGDRFDCPRASLSFRRSKAIDVQSAASAAEWLESNGYADMVTRDDPKLDKRGISRIVQSGETIPGVALVERRSLQIR